jgi:TetR/AcrR family transcriptional regulator, upper aerobic nicotinate degradation pathway regulator
MGIGEPDVKMRILLAAKKLFARQGYDATTVRQICEEAGVNVALISYYFGGKENVFNALFEIFLPNGRIQEVAAGDVEDPIESMKLLIRELTEFRLREPDMVILLQQEIMFSTPRINVIQHFAFPIWVYLRKVLEVGRERGAFRFHSLDHAFMSAVGAILYQNKLNYFGPLLSDVDRYNDNLVEELTRFILQALGYSTSGTTK